MYTVENIRVPSSDGIHSLNGVIYRPAGEIRGLFHLVHGMTEYIGRYDHLFSHLANEGFVVFGYDNLGHGHTAHDDSELGFIAEKDGFEYLVRDVKLFEDKVRKDYPDLPLILMGHSMGSFIARLAAQRNGDSLAGLIICGTGGPLAATPLGLMLTSIIKKIYGGHHISPLAEHLAFGSFNKRFEGISKNDWLTTDRKQIEKYESDKYCTFHFTISALHDLIKLNSLANHKNWFASLNKKLPTLIVSGTDDPVGNYGKGVQTVHDKLKQSGKENLKIKLYSGCRHEIHNDTCADQMFADITEFCLDICK